MNFFVLFLGMSGLLLPSSCKLDSRVESSSKVRIEQQGIERKLSDLEFAIIGEKIGLPKPGEGIKNIYAVDPALGLIDNENSVFILLNRPNGPQEIKVTSSAGGVSASKTISVAFATPQEIVEWRYKHIFEEGGGLKLTSQGQICSTSANNRTDVLKKLLFSYSSSYYSPSLYLENELSLEKLAALGLKINWKATKSVEINTDLSKSEITITPPAQKTESEIMAQLVLKEVGSQEEVKSNKTKTWYVNVLPQSEYPKAKAEDKVKAEAEFKKAEAEFKKAEALFEAHKIATSVMNPNAEKDTHADKDHGRGGKAYTEATHELNSCSFKTMLDKGSKNLEDAQFSITSANEEVLKITDVARASEVQSKIDQAQSAYDAANSSKEEAFKAFEDDDSIIKYKKDAFDVLVRAAQAYSVIFSSYHDAYNAYKAFAYKAFKGSDHRNFSDVQRQSFANAYQYFLQDAQLPIKPICYYSYIKAYNKNAQEALNEAQKASDDDPSNTSKIHARKAAEQNFNDLNKAFLPMHEAYIKLEALIKDFSTKVDFAETLADEAEEAAADAAPKTD